MDGWTTNPAVACPFGCTHGQDAIPHYAFCPHVARLAQARLRLPTVAAASRLDAFLLLDVASDELVPRALAAYATFKAANASRHGTAGAEGAWLQALAEGSG